MAWNHPQGQPAAECPHVHFKTRVIDRNILTKRQHLDLLCTPRGYRWEVAFVKEEGKRLVCSSKPSGKPTRKYVYNLLADLWSVVSPDIVKKLQEMMEKEFGMSKDEASDFVCKQMKEMMKMKDDRREDADISSDDQPSPLFITKDIQRSRCRCHMAINVKPRVVKSLADILAKKLAEAATFMTAGKRGHRQRRMSEVLLNGFCRLSGEHFNPDEPKSELHKLQVLLADKLAMWLASYIIDEENVLAKNRKREDAKILESSLRKAKEYDKKMGERAALTRKIEIQKMVADTREEESNRKDEEATKNLEESRRKKKEVWDKKDKANKINMEAKAKENTKNKDKLMERKKDDTKNKRDAATMVRDITGNAEQKSAEAKKKQVQYKPITASKHEAKL